MRGILILLMVAVMVSPAYAQLGGQSFPDVDFSDSVLTEAEIEVAETAFSEPGLLPDHPLYFLKRFAEGVRLAFAFGKEEKARVHLDLAKTRLAEAKRLAEEKKAEAAQKALDGFGKELDEFGNATKGIGMNVSVLVQEAEDVLDKSALVLSLVMEKIPEQAKPAVERALNNSIEKKVRIKIKAEAKAEEEIETEERIEKEIGVETERNEEIRSRIAEKTLERKKKRAEKGKGVICIQVITPARNPVTGEVKEFPTPCDVPRGWEKVGQGVIDVGKGRKGKILQSAYH